jgi:hypothetical protein
MTELHAGLALYRDQLRDAVALDLDRGRGAPRRRARATRALIPAAGLAAAGIAVALVATGASPPVPSADAAIMRHVTAALTAPPATILHERALVTSGSTTATYELWQQSAPPHSYRVIKWGHEGSGTGGEPTDPAAELRALVASGNAHVDASVTFDGVPAYKMSVSGSADKFLNGTAYVARSDYYPLEIDTTSGGGERIVVQAYEYLPATAANLAKLR